MEFGGDDIADADILANEDSPPMTHNVNQCPTCSVCEGISSEDNEETCCNKSTQNGNRSVRLWYISAFVLLARLYSFYLTVVAYPVYTDGILHFFGNVLAAELHAECTGPGCQSG